MSRDLFAITDEAVHARLLPWAIVAAETTPPTAPASALVIVPTYNERPNLEVLVQGIRAAGCAVLVVDDNSPDGTGEIADRLAAEDSGVSVVHRPGKLGLGTAEALGLARGASRGYDLLITMDADGSHHPSHLSALMAASRQGRRVAIGSRYIQGGAIVGWPAHRKALSHGANLYCREILGLDVHDCTSGYRCYPREAVQRLQPEAIAADGYAFLIETLHRCVQLGIPVTEVPIRFEDRVAGRSKVSAAEIRKALTLVPRLRWDSLRRGRGPTPPPGEKREVELLGTPRRPAARVRPPEPEGRVNRP